MKSRMRTLVVIGLLPGILVAADWPTWRYDAARSAATPHELPDQLTLRWSRQRPPVRPAWPGDSQDRLSFDRAYEPVVMNGRLFLGSPNDGSVRAYDADSGEEIWTFFAAGPVRVAPAVWKDRLFVGSDDGYLYCLQAADGALRWKFRGAPDDRPDRRHLGNGHLVSYWPVRGGPVVAGNAVYFGVGLWSIHGVFIYSLDAETGAVLWENTRLDHIANVRSHHGVRDTDGLSPQGHLAVAGDRLLVPSGRSLPAGLELDTGRLVYWVRGFHHGDSRIAVHGELAFVGREAVVNTYDFREVGSRWAYAGDQAPEGYARHIDHNHVGNRHRADLGEAQFAPYKFAPGCDVDSAFRDGLAFGLQDGTFYAHDVRRARNADRLQTVARWRRELDIWTWEPPRVWAFETGRDGPDGPVILAGTRLYGSVGNMLMAVDVQEPEPALAWQMEVEGVPTRLVAAANKLFVVTADGWIHAFGDAEQPLESGRFENRPAAPAVRDPAAAVADAILRATGVQAGFGLVLGLETGDLLEALLTKTDLHLFAVDPDPDKVDGLRRRFAAAGWLGNRVQLFVGDPFTFHFPSYLANLVVSENAAAAGFSFEIDAARMLDLLRPYGGTLCLAADPERATAFEAWAAAAAEAEAARLRRAHGFSLLVREAGLPGAAPWTHDAADAARTFVSRDDRVRAPLGVLWFGDVEHATGPGRYWRDRPLVSRGQVFMCRSQSVPSLMSYDAYTGRSLWTRRLPSTTRGYGIAVHPDGRAYVAADGRCFELDPETGRDLDVHVFAPEGETTVKELRVEDDILVIAVDAALKSGPIVEDVAALVALDRITGDLLWRRDADFRFSIHAVSIGGGMVFCADAVPVHETAAAGRRGEVMDEARESVVRALDVRTGDVRWETRMAHDPQNTSRRENWLAYASGADVLIGGRFDLGFAWDARTGAPLWDNVQIGNAPVLVRNDDFLVITGGGRNAEIHDLKTGEAGERFQVRRGHGCNQILGGRHLLAARDGSAGYFDLAHRTAHRMINVRSGCKNSLIQAEGLLNAAFGQRHTCRCSYSFQTLSGLLHMPEIAAWRSSEALPMTVPPARPREP